MIGAAIDARDEKFFKSAMINLRNHDEVNMGYVEAALDVPFNDPLITRRFRSGG